MHHNYVQGIRGRDDGHGVCAREAGSDMDVAAGLDGDWVEVVVRKHATENAPRRQTIEVVSYSARRTDVERLGRRCLDELAHDLAVQLSLSSGSGARGRASLELTNVVRCIVWMIAQGLEEGGQYVRLRVARSARRWHLSVTYPLRAPRSQEPAEVFAALGACEVGRLSIRDSRPAEISLVLTDPSPTGTGGSLLFDTRGSG